MKKFLIIGNLNAVTYKEIFPLIKDNQFWLGVSRNGCGQMYFCIDDNAPQAKGQIVVNGQRMQTIGSSAWYTNLGCNTHKPINLYKHYNPNEYPKYDNYNAINVNKVSDIPMGYNGLIGVPITFLGKHCLEQFEIIDKINTPYINGKAKYQRLIIKKIIDMKKFLIIGNMNAITYKEIFPLIKDNKLWYGPSISSGDREFMVPESYPIEAAGWRIDEKGKKYIRVKGVRWFTNLDHKKRHEPIDLYKHYNEEEYPKYDNYDAINVNKVSDIPMDYDGIMGIPISFLDKYCPEQFEIIDKISPFINGKPIYKRLIIKKIIDK